MINNISTMDTRPQMNVQKTMSSFSGMHLPAIIGFKTKPPKLKADIRIKKIKRGDNIPIIGEIDDNYVDIVEEVIPYKSLSPTDNFFESNYYNELFSMKKKTKFLKNCYIIDYIQSPKTRCGLGTEAIKALAEKAMFDPKAEGRIVTFSSPLIKEASPAIFFYKLGFRFIDPNANEYIEQCILKKEIDTPPQTGMMYLPQKYLQRLLRYGDLF